MATRKSGINSPVEVDRLSHYSQGFMHSRWWSPDSWTINSITSMSRLGRFTHWSLLANMELNLKIMDLNAGKHVTKLPNDYFAEFPFYELNLPMCTFILKVNGKDGKNSKKYSIQICGNKWSLWKKNNIFHSAFLTGISLDCLRWIKNSLINHNILRGSGYWVTGYM